MLKEIKIAFMLTGVGAFSLGAWGALFSFMSLLDIATCGVISATALAIAFAIGALTEGDF